MANKNEHTKNTDTKLLTVGQVKSLLNISRTTLYELGRTGKLSYHKINRMVRYKPEDVQQFLDNSAQDRAAS